MKLRWLRQKTARFTVVARPVFLSSGTINSAALQAQTGVIPVLGTLPGNALVTPPQQNASGIGGELQMSTANLGLAVGYTPYEFPVSNITARGTWRPGGGHFSIFGDRDSVKETQLSYAGLRDPGSATPFFPGNIWGGVVSTGGGARFDLGNERSGFYLSADGASLTGYHVLDNSKFEGTTGAYFRVKVFPEYGSLNVGATIFGMHYSHNELGLTYGQGGYFSPQAYFLAAVPVSFTGHYKTDFHYVVAGSIGVQTFQSDSAPYYPLDRGTQTDSGNPYYPAFSNTGFNYSINSEGSYRIADPLVRGRLCDRQQHKTTTTPSAAASSSVICSSLNMPTTATRQGCSPSRASGRFASRSECAAFRCGRLPQPLKSMLALADFATYKPIY